ncbi:hypothetical protein HID58_065886, partial [Brassica napus]
MFDDPLNCTTHQFWWRVAVWVGSSARYLLFTFESARRRSFGRVERRRECFFRLVSCRRSLKTSCFESRLPVVSLVRSMLERLEGIIQGGFLAWRDDALAWRPWREKIGLHVRVVVPGDGGYHRSVVAGFSPGGGVEAPSAPPTPVQVPGKGIRAADEKLEAFGSSAKLEVLSAEVKSVNSTIRWFSMRASRVLSGSKAEMISAGRTMSSLVVGSLVVAEEISMVVSAEALRVSELWRNKRSGDLFWFLPESMMGKLRRRNACRSEWCRSSH